MKVGIGLTTCNRPQMLEAFKDSLEANNMRPHKLFINDDTTTQKGVAYSKNNCLYNLKDCDLILLMDDDCHFKNPNALDFIIQGHERSKQHHFLFMHPTHHEYVKTWHTPLCDIELYNSCSGVFMSVTKKAFNTVGYLDSRYVKYGYEHAGYSRRIHLSGLNVKPFMMLKGMSEYFVALDFEGKIESSISQAEKDEFTAINGVNDQIYHSELSTWYDVKREFQP